MAALTPSIRFFESQLVEYKRTWRSSVFSSFGNPVLFLAAMGLGLGSLVDSGTGDLEVPYLAFVATGLLAAGAMQSGAGEGLWRIMAGVKWRKNFHGAITTPVSPADIVVGRAIYVLLRTIAVTLIFAVVAWLFGALELGPGLLAVVPAAITGVCFAMALTAFTVTQESDENLATVFRFVILPLFLFSGTFFPVSQLPGFLQPVAWATPLFHGVELCRKVALPGVGGDLVSAVPAWVHLVYLLVVTGVSMFLAAKFLDRRLRP
jgi:lipooligosaccharide transport system permease protein